MKLTRRQAILAALGTSVVGVGADAFFLEPRWLEVTRHVVPIAGLPPALEGFTLVHLTDAHLKGTPQWTETIVQAVRQAAPGLVVMTGDMVECEAALPHLLELGSGLVALRGRVLATLGNWEHWGELPLERLRRAYADFGARLLLDEVCTVEGVTVLATDDAYGGHPNLRRLAGGATAPAPRLLLTHSPAVLDLAGGRIPGVDLALAGHTHGGQARLGPLAPIRPPGSGRFVAGFYDTPVGLAYVSRGLGLSVIPARVLCRPELPVFRLVRG